jgi:hypothetical protein
VLLRMFLDSLSCSESKCMTSCLFKTSVMGHAINIVAAKLLTDGICTYYLNIQCNLDPQRRFSVRSPNARRQSTR